jgi:hypothetical protein
MLAAMALAPNVAPAMPRKVRREIFSLSAMILSPGNNDRNGLFRGNADRVYRTIQTAQMTYLAVFGIGDVRLLVVIIELYDISRTGLHTGLTAYAACDFTNWHALFLRA